MNIYVKKSGFSNTLCHHHRFNHLIVSIIDVNVLSLITSMVVFMLLVPLGLYEIN